MNITVKSKGETVQLVAGQAIKNLPDGKRMLIAMLEPADLKGMAFLVCERKDKVDTMFIYFPVLRRTREIEGSVDQYAHFLGTDFTYADLGFIKLNKQYRLLGKESHGSVQAYKVEETAPEIKDYYSRIIIWVATDTFLPLQRDYYDRAGRLWKTEHFKGVSIVNGIPTPFLIKMEDVQANQSTEIALSMVEYDIEVPDEIFDPNTLSQVARHECWGAYCPVTIPKK
jgi:hypothetical protein